MISVVTINLNNLNGLISTIKSVTVQENTDRELIIIDGLSSDGSKDYISSNANLVDICICEKDNGIYNAMNKGIINSSKDYVLFLNSGDTFYDSNSLHNLVNNLSDFDFVYGDIIDFGNSSSNIIKYPINLSFEYMLCGGLPHQATVIKKSLFTKVGLYFENYKIISDWVFFMEALFNHNASYKKVPFVISNFEGGGLSSLTKYTNLIIIEQLDYLVKRFPDSINFYLKNSPYVKKYLRHKPRWNRWYFKLILFKFHLVH